VEVDASQYKHVELYLPRFDLTVPAARTGKTLYVPIVFFCEFLEIQRDTQVDILRARYKSEAILREVPFKLKKVWRTPLSLRKPEAALWIAGIDSARCKPEVRGRLDELQQDFLQAADKILWGGAANVPEAKRGTVRYSQQDRIEFSCKDCGAPHVITIENGVVHVERQ
jgi:hypothetical protein